jgi:Tfp pilus assembly protein PilV
MRSRWPLRARRLPARLRCICRSQDGSFLVEAMVSAFILVVVGLGVLEAIDRSAELGGEQKLQAVAGNVAQTELEQVRALPLAEQSNLRRTRNVTVGAVTYSIASRADWVDDSTGDADCTTADSSADYMKLSTVVTWPQMGNREPVTLESIVTPGVRSFGENQGSLAVHVSDRNGDPVSGLQVGLSGAATLSDATSANGCVLWGYLDAGSGYSIGFSRSPDYVLPDGSQVADEPVSVAGDQTTTVAYQYDRGGYLSTQFTTRRSRTTPLIATNPEFAHVTHTGGGGVSVPFPVTGDVATSGLLFPFTSAYTVHADTCAAAEVPAVPETPVPDLPAAPSATTGIVTPGTTTTTSTMRLPSPNIRVTRDGSPLTGATVRVTTPCGTVYRRTTIANGVLGDPGFPYVTSLAICVTDGTRQAEATRSNTNFNNALNFTVNISSTTSPEGTCT